MRLFCLVLAMILLGFAGGARVACAGQFRFDDLENYPTSGTPDQQEAQLDSHALEYVKEHFPVGSRASMAVSALMRAGAKCSVDDDPYDPPGYVCIWTRPGHGLAYFVVQIEWIVGIGTDFKHNRINNLSADRGENGL